MIKQRNIFSGKVDIIADATDSKEAINKTFAALGSEAGKVIRTDRPERYRAPEPAPVNQTKLF